MTAAAIQNRRRVGASVLALNPLNREERLRAMRISPRNCPTTFTPADQAEEPDPGAEGPEQERNTQPQQQLRLSITASPETR